MMSYADFLKIAPASPILASISEWEVIRPLLCLGAEVEKFSTG